MMGINSVMRPMFDGIKKALRENVSPEARLNTDEARLYRKIAKAYAEHMVVNHSEYEYVRGEAYTNTIEGLFMLGVLASGWLFSAFIDRADPANPSCESEGSPGRNISKYYCR